MPRTKKILTQGEPPAGGSVQPVDGVREVVKQMSGHASEDELRDSLPENTMTDATSEASEPAKPRKPRRTKEEMARLRGKEPEQELDPLMSDPRYAKAVGNMRSAGMKKTVVGGFDTAAKITKDEAWELEKDEVEQVDDFSYVCSKKFPILDPTAAWWTMAIYFFAMLGTFIAKRVAQTQGDELIEKLREMVFGEEKQKTAQELQDEKAGSV